MKLLPRKELNTKLNDQKKTEIDAGLFLAKKIDALRENLLDTQNEHDKSIEALKKEYQEFSTEQTSRRGELIKEIGELKIVREALQKPLDEAWARFYDEEVKQIALKNNLAKLSDEALFKEIELNRKQDETDKLSKEIIQNKEETEHLLQRTERLFEARQKEGREFIKEREIWELKKFKEEKDIFRRKVEADNSKKEYELYLDNVKKKERLLDLKLKRR